MPESKTSPRRISAVEKATQALGMRMAGNTYEEIAHSLGYKGASGALYAVEKALDRVPAPEVGKFRKLNLGRLNKIIQVWWPLMLDEDASVADRSVATDKVRGAVHDIRQLYRLDVPAPREPILGSTPDNPLHVSASQGEIDWDAVPWELADRFLAINDELVALQPGSGGLLLDGGSSP
ncbi:MAG: hypothetical protein O2913_13195 [Chloroflexi bacterium]|nr:hypothetical protein [Chloroflexota bacterium]